MPVEPQPDRVPVTPAPSATLLKTLLVAKQQADRDFDLVHGATCLALGLDPQAYAGVEVDPAGAVVLIRVPEPTLPAGNGD